MGTEFSNPNAFNYNQIRPTKNTKSKNQTLRNKKQQTVSNQNTRMKKLKRNNQKTKH